MRHPFFLSTWTLHRMFFGGFLELSQMPLLSRTLGCRGVELEDIFFRSTTSRYVANLRKAAEESDQQMSLALSNDLTYDSSRAIDRSVAKTLTFLDVAAELGVPIVRVLIGSRRRSRTALEQARRVLGIIAEEAQARRIRIAVENHDPLSRRVDVLLGLVRDFGTSGLGVCLDTGNFPAADRYTSIRACMPLAHMIHAKAWNFRQDGEETSISYRRIAGFMRSARFNGPVILEYDGKGDQLMGTVRLKQLLERHLGA